jgi:hypothetical protein
MEHGRAHLYATAHAPGAPSPDALIAASSASAAAAFWKQIGDFVKSKSDPPTGWKLTATHPIVALVGGKLELRVPGGAPIGAQDDD